MIWIITSWIENINLIKLCQQSETPFCILADTQWRPYQDKTISYQKSHIQWLLEEAEKIWCTHIILPPINELEHFHTKEYKLKNTTIIPLFTEYINYCFWKSLVWKIGYIWGYSNIQYIEKIHNLLSKQYIITNQQQQTKNFQQPLSKRTKDTSMREYFLRLLSPRQMMINKIIKTDLKYFKDANVDTIIPLSYSYFNFQTTISNFFNPKKQKFHKRNIIENIFTNTIKEKNIISWQHKTVTIYHTWSQHFFTGQKKWERLLSQWNKLSLIYKEIVI